MELCTGQGLLLLCPRQAPYSQPSALQQHCTPAEYCCQSPYKHYAQFTCQAWQHWQSLDTDVPFLKESSPVDSCRGWTGFQAATLTEEGCLSTPVAGEGLQPGIPLLPERRFFQTPHSRLTACLWHSLSWVPGIALPLTHFDDCDAPLLDRRDDIVLGILRSLSIRCKRCYARRALTGGKLACIIRRRMTPSNIP